MPVSRSSRAGAPSMPQRRSAARHSKASRRSSTRACSSGRSRRVLVRFVLLETVREHAAELLDDEGDRAAIESSHGAYYTALAENTVLIGVADSDAISVLDLELDNLRAAFDRAEAAGDHETALRIATALYYYWYLKGYFREGRDRIRRPLDRGAGQREAAGARVRGACRSDVAPRRRRGGRGIGETRYRHRNASGCTRGRHALSHRARHGCARSRRARRGGLAHREKRRARRRARSWARPPSPPTRTSPSWR